MSDTTEGVSRTNPYLLASLGHIHQAQQANLQRVADHKGRGKGDNQGKGKPFIRDWYPGMWGKGKDDRRPNSMPNLPGPDRFEGTDTECNICLQSFVREGFVC